jgi:CheY-like chemotaxis protein
MVYGFVKGSGGHAKISSEPNFGTSVKIYLPRAAQLEMAEPARSAPPGIQKGTESVLVVEDDDEVRDTIEKLLKGLGYRVLVAADGLAALDILGRPELVDLLLTDVGLGRGMNGVELAQRARKRVPRLKVAFMSGYTQGAFHDIGLLEEEGIELLSKPFRRSELERTIRRALDSGGPSGD